MTNKVKREFLSDLLVPRENGLDGMCFRSEFMDVKHEAYPVYQAVSDAMHDSNLSFDFSYSVADRAISALLSVDNWDDEDALQEAIDNNVPVYNNQLMTIYLADWDIVDQTCDDNGIIGYDSVKRASIGWYSAMQDMVSSIINKLAKV